MKKILTILALAVVATACNKEADDTQAQVKAGAIEILPSTSTSIESRNEGAATEGKTYITQYCSDKNDLRVVVSNAIDGEFSWETLAEFYSSLGNRKLFTATTGEYPNYTYVDQYVTLSYGDIEEEGYGKAYFYGSKSFQIRGYKLSTDVNVEVKCMNTVVSVDASENFKNYFANGYSFSITTSKGTKFDWDATSTELLFVKPGDIRFNWSGKSQTGYESTDSETVTVEGNKHYRVTLDMSDASGFKIIIKLDNSIISEVELPTEELNPEA